MLGISPAMQEVFARIARVATTSAPVLIVGESGTGKELVARALHNQSRRKAGPFVAMHTGAIPKELVASELFGHEKGAFTGAMNSADGKFAVAEKGTLFLDEVGTMDIPTQSVCCACSKPTDTIGLALRESVRPTCESSRPPTATS